MPSLLSGPKRFQRSFVAQENARERCQVVAGPTVFHPALARSNSAAQGNLNVGFGIEYHNPRM